MGGPYLLGNMARGDKFPRKFGPGGPKFSGGAKFPVTPALVIVIAQHDN